jgi:hypothetical protein
VRTPSPNVNNPRFRVHPRSFHGSRQDSPGGVLLGHLPETHSGEDDPVHHAHQHAAELDGGVQHVVADGGGGGEQRADRARRGQSEELQPARVERQPQDVGGAAQGHQTVETRGRGSSHRVRTVQVVVVAQTPQIEAETSPARTSRRRQEQSPL